MYSNDVVDPMMLKSIRGDSEGYPVIGDMRLTDDAWGHKDVLRPVIVCGFVKDRTFVMTCTTTPDSVLSETYRLKDDLITSKGRVTADSNVVLKVYSLSKNLNNCRLKGRLSERDLTALLNYICFSKCKL